MAWRWPWGPEIRESFTSQVLGLQVAAASGGGSLTDAAASTAIERATILYVSAFSVAEVEGPEFVRRAITPSWLAGLVRDLLRYGDHLSVMSVVNGRLALVPASAWEVTGSADPSTWLYKVTLPGPSGPVTVSSPATAVVHAMWSRSRVSPWLGCGPLANCGLSARILGGLSRRLGDRSVQPTGGFLPVPMHDVATDGSSPNDELQSDLNKASGRLLIVNTTSGGHGDRASAPARDFNPTSFGLDIPTAATELIDSIEMKIFSATGVPPGLGSMVSSSQAVSSLYRQFIYGPVAGLAARIAAELEGKLEAAPIAFTFDRMGHRPLVERATAIGRLVKMAGMSVADAKAELGL